MHSVLDNNVILLNLARKGEPSACYSLFASQADDLYTHLCNSGRTHKEAVSILLEYFKQIYNLIKKCNRHTHVDEWLERCKQQLLADELTGHDDVITLERIAAEDSADFRAQLQKLLQRLYSRSKRLPEKAGTLQKFISQMKTKPGVLAGAIAGTAILCLGVFWLVCLLNNYQLSIAWTTSKAKYQISLPSSTNYFITYKKTTGYASPATQEIIDTVLPGRESAIDSPSVDEQENGSRPGNIHTAAQAPPPPLHRNTLTIKKPQPTVSSIPQRPAEKTAPAAATQSVPEEIFEEEAAQAPTAPTPVEIEQEVEQAAGEAAEFIEEDTIQ
ncbi:MAG: hypothetical protein GF398_16715 [Chitinivibrionales bacterium]|nr:hypothetical protein [Chitinivibrionales bacterium]